MKRLLFIMVIFTCVSCQDDIDAPAPNIGALTLAEFDELIELCDTASLTTYEDFDIRLDRIQDIFAGHKDPRGAFPTVYKAITKSALMGLQDGIYNDPEFSLKMVLDFSKRYMYSLEAHLLNQPLEFQWVLYYDHCLNGHHITRLVLEGINAHLTLDLTRALGYSGVYPEFESDWLAFGDNTVLSVPGFLEELQDEYDTDASGIFGVFFIGDILDGIFGDGATINFGFNLLRMDAFRNALRLQDPLRTDQIERNLERSFWERESLIDLVDRMNLTPRISGPN